MYDRHRPSYTIHERRGDGHNRLARTTSVVVHLEHNTIMAYMCMRCFLTSLFDCITLCACPTSRCGSDGDYDGILWLGFATTFGRMYQPPNSGYSNPSCAYIRNGTSDKMDKRNEGYVHISPYSPNLGKPDRGSISATWLVFSKYEGLGFYVVYMIFSFVSRLRTFMFTFLDFMLLT